MFLYLILGVLAARSAKTLTTASNTRRLLVLAAITIGVLFTDTVGKQGLAIEFVILTVMLIAGPKVLERVLEHDFGSHGKTHASARSSSH